MPVTSPPLAASPAVRLGSTSAYAFDGDSVRIDAELIVDTSAAAHASDWALQLWADADTDAAIKLAEVNLEPFVPDADGRARISASTPAYPPAGGREHALSLLLAARDGAALQVTDAVSYPRSETFLLPRLEGEIVYRVVGDQIEVRAQRIHNPRGANNLSGTLTLDLWALPAPYQGGAFSGIALGSTVLGTLGGQSDWHDVRAQLPFNLLPEGCWHLVLMLRECTSQGYLTRDYTNFAVPVVIAAQAEAIATPADSATLEAVSTPTAEEKTTIAAEPAQAVTAAPQSKSPKKSSVRKAASQGGARGTSRLSINQASIGELAWVKGLNERLAEGIVLGRPWAAVDDLIAVKGIGQKLLDKVRGSLKV
jgi:DNA uptake protein ComE-like DNA-binding protein